MNDSSTRLCGLIIACALGGCATPYKVLPDKPTAQFTLIGESSSEGTMYRHFFVSAYSDTECSRSDRGHDLLSIRAANGTRSESANVEIVAGEPLVFTAQYGDARFAQNRMCAVTGVFTPKPNSRYRAILSVNPDVTECKLRVAEIVQDSEIPIDGFAMPKHVCFMDGKNNHPNGKPFWTNWNIEVINP